jgi:multidrug resistance efflux pump
VSDIVQPLRHCGVDRYRDWMDKAAAEIERLRAELAQRTAERDESWLSNATLRADLAMANAEVAALKAERDEARKDAQRYRWLQSKGCYWIEIQSQPHGDYIFRGQEAGLNSVGLDAAIDAVIALQKQGGAMSVDQQTILRADLAMANAEVAALKADREDIEDLRFQLEGTIGELENALSRERTLLDEQEDCRIGSDNLHAEIDRLRAEVAAAMRKGER